MKRITIDRRIFNNWTTLFGFSLSITVCFRCTMWQSCASLLYSISSLRNRYAWSHCWNSRNCIWSRKWWTLPIVWSTTQTFEIISRFYGNQILTTLSWSWHWMFQSFLTTSFFFTTFHNDWRWTFEWFICMFESVLSVNFFCWGLRTLTLLLFSLVKLRGRSCCSLDWSRTFRPRKVVFVDWSVFSCNLNIKHWLALKSSWLLFNCPLLHWFIYNWVVLTCLI